MRSAGPMGELLMRVYHVQNELQPLFLHHRQGLPKKPLSKIAQYNYYIVSCLGTKNAIPKPT